MTIFCSDGHYDVLAKLASSARSFLEVGVQEGGSLRAVLDAGQIENLALCDTWDLRHGGTGRGSHEHIGALLEKAGYTGDVTYLDGRSQDTLPGFSGEYDLTHVDGGHSYEEALADLRNVWPKTRQAMVVHDLVSPPVWLALLHFVGSLGSVVAECAFVDQGTMVLRRMA